MLRAEAGLHPIATCVTQGADAQVPQQNNQEYGLTECCIPEAT